MANEETKSKTTKKKVEKAKTETKNKKKTVAKVEKKETKKAPAKKVEKKIEKKIESKKEPAVKKESAVVKEKVEEKIEEKVPTSKKVEPKKELRSISKDQEILMEAREKRKIVETTLLVLLAIIILILLCNRTFFHTEYKNDSMYIELPMFTYYVRDNEETVTLKTIRKSEYVEEYFENYLSNLDYYQCDGKVIYYDKEHKSPIFSVVVDRSFSFNPVKTITIKYSKEKLEDLCVGNPYIDPIEPMEPDYIYPEDDANFAD